MILKTYSQAGQDIFVRILTKFKKEGFFVDLGCNHPFNINNTAALEELGWNGIMIDYQEHLIELCKTQRKAVVIQADLYKENIIDIFDKNNVPKIIDYISFDVDAATNRALDNFPFDTYKFKIMTFEHDSFSVGNSIKNRAREKFLNLKYELICSDVTNCGHIYEDWYIDKTFFDPEIINEIRCSKIEHAGMEKYLNY